MVGCGHSLECRGGGEGFRREWIMHLELSRASTTAPYLYPQEELLRYRGRYDGTTPVPSRGTTVPPLHPQEVRRYHPCTWRCYACEIPVLFPTEITPGKITVVPLAGTRVVLLYLMQVQGWYCRTCSTCIIRSAPLNTSVLQFYQTAWEAGSSSLASSQLTPLQIGAPSHLPILEAFSWVTPTT